MTTDQTGKLALLWPRDAPKWHAATPREYRLSRVFDAMAALGIDAEPAIYADDVAEQVREQLLRCDGVLVWVDPSLRGDRVVLDALLRDVASNGVWVSAHPDVILKMGVKEVFHRTRHLAGARIPICIARRSVPRTVSAAPASGGAAGPQTKPRQRRPRRVEGRTRIRSDARRAIVRVLHARRGSVPEEMPLGDFMGRCEAYFANDGCIIDQPFQARLPDGMIRCYMGADKVVGFGHQLIKALIPPPPEGPDSQAAQPGPRIMHPASAPEFQALRTKMESEWTPQMMQLLDIDAASLPIIWDADFLYGPRDARARTPTCFAKSMSVRCFHFRNRRRRKLPASRRLDPGRTKAAPAPEPK